MEKNEKQRANYCSTSKISRAAEASRNMSIEERAKILVKAGLATQEQVSNADRKNRPDK
jgi:hypothetical protein